MNININSFIIICHYLLLFYSFSIFCFYSIYSIYISSFSYITVIFIPAYLFPVFPPTTDDLYFLLGFGWYAYSASFNLYYYKDLHYYLTIST